MYWTLYHGRKDPNKDMSKDGEWGFQGPVFKITAVNRTYGIMDIIIDEHTRISIGEQGPLAQDVINKVKDPNGDMVLYDGYYYGEWEIIETLNDVHKYILPFDINKLNALDMRNVQLDTGPMDVDPLKFRTNAPDHEIRKAYDQWTSDDPKLENRILFQQLIEKRFYSLEFIIIDLLEFWQD